MGGAWPFQGSPSSLLFNSWSLALHLGESWSFLGVQEVHLVNGVQ